MMSEAREPHVHAGSWMSEGPGDNRCKECLAREEHVAEMSKRMDCGRPYRSDCAYDAIPCGKHQKSAAEKWARLWDEQRKRGDEGDKELAACQSFLHEAEARGDNLEAELAAFKLPNVTPAEHVLLDDVRKLLAERDNARAWAIDQNRNWNETYKMLADARDRAWRAIAALRNADAEDPALDAERILEVDVASHLSTIREAHPSKVALISSMRFEPYYAELVDRLGKPPEPWEVLTPRGSPADYEGLPPEAKARLKWQRMVLFFGKIDAADLVLVYNRGGYVGANGLIEIGYAIAKRKRLAFAFPADGPSGTLEVAAVAEGAREAPDVAAKLGAPS